MSRPRRRAARAQTVMRRRAPLALALVLVGSWCTAPAALAAPGDLDPTFSGDGTLTTDFGGDGRAAGVAIQADGKVVVAGTLDGDLALARYNADGSLDPTFSGDGLLTTDLGGDDSAAGVAIQADGKVVVAGRSDGDFALARYGTDGSLDAGFSGDGLLTTDLGGDDSAAGVAIQADGNVVVAGTAYVVGSTADFALARYGPDGSLDPTFSDDGLLTTDLGDDGSAAGVALEPGGKVVVAGRVGSSFFSGDFALARYNADGSLDPTFSGDGLLTTDLGGYDGVAGVATQADGKVVVAGGSGFGGVGDFVLARYGTDGSLDSTFSGDGLQTTDLGDQDRVAGVALQTDGKVVVAGTSGDVLTGDFAVARYDSDGSLDPTFSGDGLQTTDVGGDGRAAGVAIQAGKVVVAGVSGFGGAGDLALARYGPDGSPDTGFSGDGLQTTDLGGYGYAAGVALQSDGKVVVAGTVSGDFALARHNPDGSPDAGFSGDGRLTTDLGGAGSAAGVAIHADGKVVVAGTSAGDFALARYDSDGSLDPTFSGDGILTTDLDGDDGAAGVAVQLDGKVVVAGTSDADFAIARYLPDGSLDAGFSGDGMLTTDLGGYDGAAGVALQADGKVVVAGESDGDFAVARYGPDGSLDAGFSGDGLQTTDLGDSGYYADAAGVALQPDGKVVVVGGYPPISMGSVFVIARYSPDGSLDASFSGDGLQTTDLGGYGSAAGVAIQADGKVVVAGGSDDDFAIARHNPDGSLDAGFSGDGLQTTDLGGYGSAAGVAIQADGKVVVAGGSDGDFALARYDGEPDTTPPETTITLAPPNVGTDATPTFGFASTEAGSTFECRMDSAGFAPCSSPHTAAALADGAHAFEVWATDPAGNADQTPVRREFTVDTAPPETTITLAPPNVGTDATPTFEFSSTEEGSTFECRVDSAGFAPCSSPHTAAALADGAHAFEVRATDPAGNADQTPVRREFTVDATPPETTITLAPPNVGTDATPTFGFASTEQGATFRCRIDSAPFASCSSPHTAAALAPGAHAFEVRATDPAGNADPTPARRAFTVAAAPRPVVPDVTAPPALPSGPASQRAGSTVGVTVSCGAEACWASASATLRIPGTAKAFPLRSATVLVAKGSRATLKLKLSKQALRAVRAALRGGRKVSVKVAVRVSDAAGNARTARRTVRLKR